MSDTREEAVRGEPEQEESEATARARRREEDDRAMRASAQRAAADRERHVRWLLEGAACGVPAATIPYRATALKLVRGQYGGHVAVDVTLDPLLGAQSPVSESFAYARQVPVTFSLPADGSFIRLSSVFRVGRKFALVLVPLPAEPSADDPFFVEYPTPPDDGVYEFLRAAQEQAALMLLAGRPRGGTCDAYACVAQCQGVLANALLRRAPRHELLRAAERLVAWVMVLANLATASLRGEWSTISGEAALASLPDELRRLRVSHGGGHLLFERLASQVGELGAVIGSLAEAESVEDDEVRRRAELATLSRCSAVIAAAARVALDAGGA